MRVPISWLREFVDAAPDAQAIADRLAMLGFPVAEIERRPKITRRRHRRIATARRSIRTPTGCTSRRSTSAPALR